MKYRNLLIASAISLLLPATINTLKAQRDDTYPQNKVAMNAYTYAPVLYQRGSSTADARLFPNPARSTTNLYINSIREQENGEMAIFNTGGTLVYRNIAKNGNNTIDLGNLQNGIYIVKIFTRDRFIYTSKLMVQK